MLDPRTIFKYLAIQLAQLVVIVGVLLVVRSFVHVPAWAIALVLVVWILKDIILYPWLWRAYAYPDTNPLSELVGMEATAVETLDPEGFVRVRGELWRARLVPSDRDKSDGTRPALHRGGHAKVVDVRGSTLLVEPSLSD